MKFNKLVRTMAAALIVAASLSASAQETGNREGPGIVVLPFTITEFDRSLQIDPVALSMHLTRKVEGLLSEKKYKVKPIRELRHIDETRLTNYIRGTEPFGELKKSLAGEILVTGSIVFIRKEDDITSRGARVRIDLRLIDIYAEEISASIDVKEVKKNSKGEEVKVYFEESAKKTLGFGSRTRSEDSVLPAGEKVLETISGPLFSKLEPFYKQAMIERGTNDKVAVTLPAWIKSVPFLVAVESSNNSAALAAETQITRHLTNNDIQPMDREQLEDLRKEGVFNQLFNGGKLSSEHSRMLDRKFPTGSGFVIIGRLGVEGGTAVSINVKVIQIPSGKIHYADTWTGAASASSEAGVNSVLRQLIAKNSKSMLDKLAEAENNQSEGQRKIEVRLAGFSDARVASKFMAAISKLTAKGIVRFDGDITAGVLTGSILYDSKLINGRDALVDLIDNKVLNSGLKFSFATITDTLLEGTLTK